MSVAPIDLQTMYANMNNVARTVSHQQQGVQLAQQLQESKIIQQTAEKAAAVQKTADNEAKSTGINDEGHNSGSAYGGGRNKQDSNQQSQPKKESEIRETYLGLHINIER